VLKKKWIQKTETKTLKLKKNRNQLYWGVTSYRADQAAMNEPDSDDEDEGVEKGKGVKKGGKWWVDDGVRKGNGREKGGKLNRKWGSCDNDELVQVARLVEVHISIKYDDYC
jgi:hypothetical protein